MGEQESIASSSSYSGLLRPILQRIIKVLSRFTEQTNIYSYDQALHSPSLTPSGRPDTQANVSTKTLYGLPVSNCLGYHDNTFGHVIDVVVSLTDKVT